MQFSPIACGHREKGYTLRFSREFPKTRVYFFVRYKLYQQMQSFSSFIFQLLTYFNAASKKFKNVDVIDNEI